MAFVWKDEKKGLSLPGLIDIIFLLLIFSLITLSVSQTNVETKKRGSRHVNFNLPETKSSETEEISDVLQTLMFQIEDIDSTHFKKAKVVFVLWPSTKDSLTIREAKLNAVQDSLFAVFPENFLKLTDREFNQTKACRLIHSEIKKYKDTYFLEPSPTNSVEIRAVKDTEFRIVNFIMEQCSAYGDTIPQIMLRTLAGKEVAGGF